MVCIQELVIQGKQEGRQPGQEPPAHVHSLPRSLGADDAIYESTSGAAQGLMFLPFQERAVSLTLPAWLTIDNPTDHKQLLLKHHNPWASPG